MATKTAPGVVIWLNSFPGVGKTAIARELKEMMGEAETIIIDHNEILVRTTPGATEDIPAYKANLQDALVEHIFQESDKTVIVLEYLKAENGAHKNLAQRYLTAATVSNRPFHPFYLACDPKENNRRYNTPDRRTAHGKKKDIQVRDYLWNEIADHQPLRLTQRCFTIDVTPLTPRQAATAILDRVQDQEKGIKWETALGDDSEWTLVTQN